MSDHTPLIIAGRNPVREVLERDPHSIEKIYLLRDAKRLHHIRSLAHQKQIPVQVLPAGGLKRLAGGALHQGVIAVQPAFAYADYTAMLAKIAPDLDTVRSLQPRLWLLDGIQDPRNFGAIVRCAVAFDVKGILVSSHHMAPVSPAMVKASSGAALRIPIARVGRLADVIGEIKERGYYVYGASHSGSVSMWNINWKYPIALVIGSEGRGLFSDNERLCDQLLSIPISGDMESLNASVATGILLAKACQPSP